MPEARWGMDRSWRRRLLTVVGVGLTVGMAVGMAPVVAIAQSNPTGQFDVTTFPEPYLLLVRDPAIHDALKLTETQRKQVLEHGYALDDAFWKLRGGTREQALTGLAKLRESLQQSVSPLLEKPQRQRLTQIQLQLAGFQSFFRPQVIKALALSEDQQRSLKRAIEKFQSTFKTIQGSFAKADDELQREKLKADASQLRSDLRGEVSAILNNQQKAKWQVLMGERIDPSQLGKVKFKAPEIDPQSVWLNAPEAADRKLEGKVVAMHFYAFQCVNCQRNQPWYKQWHKELSGRGVVVLGIQTPEVASERDIQRVAANARENQLVYPIIMDDKRTHWKAWGNTMWPSTYLIDKQGFVRYWWLGELNWQNAGIQEQFRKRLYELLEE